MTSNAGSEIIQQYMSRLGSGVSENGKAELLSECKNGVLDVLKRSVRPEFLNRIDEVIMFEPLNKEDILGILQLQINQIASLLREKGIELEFTPAAMEYLSSKGYDIAYGARPIKRLLQKELINELATKIISGEIARDGHIEIDCAEGKLIFKNLG